jgi:hypothetical protein
MLKISRNKTTGLVEYGVLNKWPSYTNMPILIPKIKQNSNKDVSFNEWKMKHQNTIDVMYNKLILTLHNIQIHDHYIEIYETLYDAFAEYLYNTSKKSRSFMKLL